ncbi:hypothetical protein [Gilvimarinus agarilyticus]|uniref:hypothetical protein n=1 Tax=Gilvimarinus agarilyticus TaxID=679259 RepID=UPI0005A10D00|nr:hypothetical protein [Gilvimarinus agarilyticus]
MPTEPSVGQWLQQQRNILWLAGALLVASCERNESVDNAGNASPDIAAEEYVAPDPGFIKNPGFSREGGDIAEWSMIQHAGEKSFDYTTEAGVLTITRTDIQPWGMIRQSLDRKDTKPLQGKTLEFSAELSASLNDEFGAALDPSGLRVRIKGVKRGSPAMLGTAILLTDDQAIAGTKGDLPWQRYALQFKVPAETEASNLSIELSVMLASGGSIAVRGPALQEVAATGDITSGQ